MATKSPKGSSKIPILGTLGGFLVVFAAFGLIFGEMATPEPEVPLLHTERGRSATWTVMRPVAAPTDSYTARTLYGDTDLALIRIDEAEGLGIGTPEYEFQRQHAVTEALIKVRATIYDAESKFQTLRPGDLLRRTPSRPEPRSTMTRLGEYPDPRAEFTPGRYYEFEWINPANSKNYVWVNENDLVLASPPEPGAGGYTSY